MKNLSLLLCILIFTLSAFNDYNSKTSGTLKIPELTDIKIDGSAEDWGVKGLPVQLLADYRGSISDRPTFKPISVWDGMIRSAGLT